MIMKHESKNKFDYTPGVPRIAEDKNTGENTCQRSQLDRIGAPSPCGNTAFGNAN